MHANAYTHVYQHGRGKKGVEGMKCSLEAVYEKNECFRGFGDE